MLKTQNTSAAKKRNNIIVLMCLLLPVSFVLAIAYGTVSIPMHDVWNTLISVDGHSKSNVIIEQIRLPRALLGVFIGALLGICGASTQGLFRNPLADPSLIGVTAGASMGGSLTIFFASKLTLGGLVGLSLVSVGAFLGGVITVLFVYQLSSNKEQGTSVATMLLAGIAITALAGGLTSLLEFFSSNEMLRQISLWRMGGLDGANFKHVSLAMLVSIAILYALPHYSTALNALLLGESEARHLGISVQTVKLKIVFIVAAGIGISVALAGTIVFVGLVVPHIIRLLIGPDHRYLLPMSAVGGAILLLLADTLARTVFAPTELPVGIVTTLLGAPFFISLLRHRHEYGMR